MKLVCKFRLLWTILRLFRILNFVLRIFVLATLCVFARVRVFIASHLPNRKLSPKVTSPHGEFRSIGESPARTGYYVHRPICPGSPCSAANTCRLRVRARASERRARAENGRWKKSERPRGWRAGGSPPGRPARLFDPAILRRDNRRGTIANRDAPQGSQPCDDLHIHRSSIRAGRDRLLQLRRSRLARRSAPRAATDW